MDALAQASGVTPSQIVTRAVESYLAVQDWQIEEIRRGLAEADAGEFAPAEDVEAVFKKWSDAG